MGVIISAVLVIYFSKNVLDYFSFFRKLAFFIVAEKDQLIPNLSFNLDIIRRGLRIVKGILMLKMNLFLFCLWIFLMYVFSTEWVANEIIGIILAVLVILNLALVINEKYFQACVLYKGEKVKFRGWDKLQIKGIKEDLTFYLIKNELVLTGHFEVTNNENKNDYWKRFTNED